MNGTHQGFSYAERFVENLGDGGKAVGGTTGVGDNLILGGVKFLVVDTDNKGPNFLGIFTGGRDDYPCGTSFEMIFRPFISSKPPRGLDDVISTELAPR